VTPEERGAAIDRFDKSLDVMAMVLIALDDLLDAQLKLLEELRGGEDGGQPPPAAAALAGARRRRALAS